VESQELTVQSNFGFVFEAFGVRVRIVSDQRDLATLAIEVAEKALVGRLTIIDNWAGTVDHTFGVFRSVAGGFYYTHEGTSSASLEREIDFRRLFNTMIRLHVAEKATNWVFIHAGVVGWRGQAILLPAMSHNGKTTLVSELIRLGAEYYSDEYAVIDSRGMVHSFERDLSVRPPGSEIPIQVPPAEFGAVIGNRPIPVGMVVITRYNSDSVFQPEMVSLGLGIMEVIPEVIPIRLNTDFSLKVLNTAFRRAIIIKSLRGEARIAARSILSYFDDNFNLAK
jgi:hypothetical protein